MSVLDTMGRGVDVLRSGDTDRITKAWGRGTEEVKEQAAERAPDVSINRERAADRRERVAEAVEDTVPRVDYDRAADRRERVVEKVRETTSGGGGGGQSARDRVVQQLRQQMSTTDAAAAGAAKAGVDNVKALYDEATDDKSVKEKFEEGAVDAAEEVAQRDYIQEEKEKFDSAEGRWDRWAAATATGQEYLLNNPKFSVQEQVKKPVVALGKQAEGDDYSEEDIGETMVQGSERWGEIYGGSPVDKALDHVPLGEFIEQEGRHYRRSGSTAFLGVDPETGEEAPPDPYFPSFLWVGGGATRWGAKKLGQSLARAGGSRLLPGALGRGASRFGRGLEKATFPGRYATDIVPGGGVATAGATTLGLAAAVPYVGSGDGGGPSEPLDPDPIAQPEPRQRESGGGEPTSATGGTGTSGPAEEDDPLWGHGDNGAGGSVPLGEMGQGDEAVVDVATADDHSPGRDGTLAEEPERAQTTVLTGGGGSGGGVAGLSAGETVAAAGAVGVAGYVAYAKLAGKTITVPLTGWTI